MMPGSCFLQETKWYENVVRTSGRRREQEFKYLQRGFRRVVCRMGQSRLAQNFMWLRAGREKFVFNAGVVYPLSAALSESDQMTSCGT